MFLLGRSTLQLRFRILHVFAVLCNCPHAKRCHQILTACTLDEDECCNLGTTCILAHLFLHRNMHLDEVLLLLLKVGTCRFQIADRTCEFDLVPRPTAKDTSGVGWCLSVAMPPPLPPSELGHSLGLRDARVTLGGHLDYVVRGHS